MQRGQQCVQADNLGKAGKLYLKNAKFIEILQINPQWFLRI
jgi:hypothetical protein